MGWWFASSSSSSKKKRSKKSSSKTKASKPSHKPSITDPPNVYRPALPAPVSGARPALPPKPRPSQQYPVQPPANLYSNQNAAQSQPQFQPAGYLGAPPNWNGYQQPVVVNHHYHISHQPSQNFAPVNPPQYHTINHHSQALVPSQHHLSSMHSQPNFSSSLNRFTGSMANLAKEAAPQLYDEGLSAWHGCTQIAQSTNALYDRFNDIMTLIDHEKLCGNENKLFNCAPVQDHHVDDKGAHKKKHKDKQSCSVASSVVSGNYFSKVEQYANSKLPMDLHPLSLHMPTWPLLCLAAQYSQRVYEKPSGSERDAHVSSDWLAGPRQTCIKSVSVDNRGTIVFAIRGTASFMDWAVNLKSVPISPANFLDDPGNLCHAGFLSVAKKMIKPVAARLRQLLQEDPARSAYSLLITGHSAGGAIASLLYSHMVAQTSEAKSELNVLTEHFKRVHCITFGAPPVSLLPLSKPDAPSLRKSVFLSFVNEGDPVVRADKAYVKSLLDLLSSSPPSSSSHHKDTKSKQRSRSSSRTKKPKWKVPACTLSNAGRIVVLRSGNPHAKPKDRKTVKERLEEGVVAVTCSEEDLREVIWGDPVCHLMNLYAERIQVLAIRSVTAKH
ncbi:lipase class 3 [Fusarium longipes]|uniref:Lipase class 3 n=1 Tax=Fusarium longipes TaxID=694270 RepID=A0A395S3E9_9HYPO|nr:lipase class 3 [Fusarium longipes]